MTIHVNIGDAKTRLSQLIAAALRGEEVVVDRDGAPQVRLVPVPEATQAERERISARRRTSMGSWAEAFAGYDTDAKSLKQHRDYSDARRNLHGDDLR